MMKIDHVQRAILENQIVMAEAIWMVLYAQGTKPKMLENISELDEFVVDRCRVRGRKGLSTVFRSIRNGGLYALRASDLTDAMIVEAVT